MSKELKHSKAPWSMVEHNWRDTSIVSGEKTICTVSLNEYDDEEEQHENSIKEEEMSANIKLMTSAPELLEALIALKEYCKYHNIRLGSGIIGQIEEAINKATS